MNAAQRRRDRRVSRWAGPVRGVEVEPPKLGPSRGERERERRWNRDCSIEWVEPVSPKRRGLFGRLLCFVGLHRWTQFPDDLGPIVGLDLTCERCGRTRWYRWA